MGIRDDVRRLKQLTHKERTEDELVESFLGHLDYVLGHADEDHPSSEKFVNEGEFWRIKRGDNAGDVPDRSKYREQKEAGRYHQHTPY